AGAGLPQHRAVVVDEGGAEDDLRLRVVVEVGQGGAAVAHLDRVRRAVRGVRGPEERAGAVHRDDEAVVARLRAAPGVDDVRQAVARDVADRDGRPALRAVAGRRRVRDRRGDHLAGGAVGDGDAPGQEAVAAGSILLGQVDRHLRGADAVEVGDHRDRDDLVLGVLPLLGHRELGELRRVLAGERVRLRQALAEGRLAELPLAAVVGVGAGVAGDDALAGQADVAGAAADGVVVAAAHAAGAGRQAHVVHARVAGGAAGGRRAAQAAAGAGG